MKSRKLLIFAIITVAVILAAAITSRMRAPQSTFSTQILFPELGNRINDISAITIRGNRQTVALHLQGGQWVVASADNYPALFNKIKQNMVGMAELRIVGEKTDNPEFHDRLGVEGPQVDGSKSLMVTLQDQSGRQLAELIVGNRRQSSSHKPGLYVRKPETPRALLVEGHLDFSDKTSDWFESNLFDIPTTRVREVRISYPRTAGRPQEDLVISKDTMEQPDFSVNIPALAKESSTTILANRISRGLEEMRAENVQSLQNFTFPEHETIITTVHTFDGLVITARLTSNNRAHYANFSFAADPSAAAGTPGEAKTSAATPGTGGVEATAGRTAGTTNMTPAAEAELLNKNLSTWVYEIPDFLFDALTMRPEQFQKMKLIPDEE